jgi:hypothetical protein
MYQSLLNEDYASQQQQGRRLSYGDQFSSSSSGGSISSRENSPSSANLEYYEPSFYQQISVNALDNLYFDDAFPSKGNMVHNGIMHHNPMTGITVKNHHQLYSPVTATVTVSRHPSLPSLSPSAADECTSVAPIVPSQLPICNDLYQNFMMFSPLQQEKHQYRPLPISRHMSPSDEEGSASVSSEEFTSSSVADYTLYQLLQLLPNHEINKENMKTNGKFVKTKSTRAKRDEITKTKRRGSTVQDHSKQFLCEIEGCGKVFRRSEHLKRHTRSIHTKEKRKLFSFLLLFKYTDL